MMKNFSVLLLALTLVAPIAGCGGPDTTPQAPETTTAPPMSDEGGASRAANAEAKDKVGQADEPVS